MASPGSPDDVRARADAELLRASRAGLAADREEERARRASPSVRELHWSLARLHRQIQRRHEAAAALHLAYARRLGTWNEARRGDPGRRATARPDPLTCVGEVVGAESAVTLQGSDGSPAVIATSGALALSAVQLELTLGEGPMHDCLVLQQPVIAVRPSSAWPAYGGRAEHLGVTTVAANPLDAGGRHLGVLLTFNARSTGPGGQPVHLPTVAAAVTDNLLGVDLPSVPDPHDWDVMGPPGQDVAALIHCASGVVSENLGCSTEEALTLIIARALASGEKVESVARGIIGAPRTSQDLGG